MFFRKIQQKRYNKYLLNELQRKLDDSMDNLIIHLLLCLILQNSTNNLSHWEGEVYSSLYRVPKLKGKNKYPTEKVLYSMTLDRFGDVLSIWVITYIDQINNKENVNITNYDGSLLTNYIIDYYKWLISILAKEYFVTYDEVSKKIKELIDDYNKNIKS